jgi:hypothetical protein
MALTLGSSLLFTASLLVAACALFWPQLETLYLQSQHAAVNRTGSTGTKCPLVRPMLTAQHPGSCFMIIHFTDAGWFCNIKGSEHIQA